MKKKNFIRLLMVLTCLSISIYSTNESIKIENDNKIYKNLPTDAILANEINNYFQENKSEFVELKDYSYQEIEVLGRRRTYLKKLFDQIQVLVNNIQFLNIYMSSIIIPMNL